MTAHINARASEERLHTRITKTGSRHQLLTRIKNTRLPLSLAVVDERSNCCSTSTRIKTVETNQHHLQTLVVDPRLTPLRIQESLERGSGNTGPRFKNPGIGPGSAVGERICNQEFGPRVCE
ncbi:hypothetical protein Taro_013225 [Colocasia esculenta]|uniref:Uncharacterized protein n=1 Tax=Colocasia esculenta TaxID=4460 RepID=A0A843UFC3_COLES|nr:hypothetical protein [Colocasia esculenta]